MHVGVAVLDVLAGVTLDVKAAVMDVLEHVILGVPGIV
jgi:hypothetical protein